MWSQVGHYLRGGEQRGPSVIDDSPTQELIHGTTASTPATAQCAESPEHYIESFPTGIRRLANPEGAAVE